MSTKKRTINLPLPQERKIVIAWLEDKAYANTVADVNRNITNRGAELILMTSFLDALMLHEKLTNLGRKKPDLLVLDCKMDEEARSLFFDNIKKGDLQGKALTVASTDMRKRFCHKYYLPEFQRRGGLFVWGLFQREGLAPKVDRIAVYSADPEMQIAYSILSELELLRFFYKTAYILSEAIHVIPDWRTYFRQVKDARFGACSFSCESEDICNVSLDELDPDNLKKTKYVIINVETYSSANLLSPSSREPRLIVHLVKVPDTCVSSNDKAQKITDYINETAEKNNQFLRDLRSIGMDYILSPEVDIRTLKNVLSSKENKYFEKPLSAENRYWTLGSLFPAYYRGILKKDKAELLKLEQEIIQKTFLNWTYELGRVLRTGAYFSNGHSETEAASYPGGAIVKVSGDANRQEPDGALRSSNGLFQERTGLKLPEEGADAYSKCLDDNNTLIAQRYIIDEMNLNTKNAMDVCADVLKTLGLNKAVKLELLGHFAWNGSDKRGDNEMLTSAQDAPPVLSSFPILDMNGLPENKDNQLVRRNNQIAWTIKNILTKGYFEDVFKRSIWKNQYNKDKALYFCKGQTLWEMEANGSVHHYFRFLCLARTTLKWEEARLNNPEFLNKTKRRAWFEQGLHHHVRAYILSNLNKNEYLIFDLALGASQNCQVNKNKLPSPLDKAHRTVLNLLNNKKGFDFVSFLYIGYDVLYI